MYIDYVIELIISFIAHKQNISIYPNPIKTISLPNPHPYYFPTNPCSSLIFPYLPLSSLIFPYLPLSSLVFTCCCPWPRTKTKAGWLLTRGRKVWPRGWSRGELGAFQKEYFCEWFTLYYLILLFYPLFFQKEKKEAVLHI